jgi:hypothetical protein
MADKVLHNGLSESYEPDMPEWVRPTDEPDMRDVSLVSEESDKRQWPLTVSAAEFVRGDPLEARLRTRLDAALRAVPDIEDVAEEDREVWVAEDADVSGEALIRAYPSMVDALADEVRPFTRSDSP